MTVLPARLTAALLPQRPRRRLAQPLSRRRPRGIPRRLVQPGLKLSDPLPRQLRNGLRYAAWESASSRRSEATSAASPLTARTSMITGHTRTLQRKITRCAHHRITGVPAQARNDREDK